MCEAFFKLYLFPEGFRLILEMQEKKPMKVKALFACSLGKQDGRRESECQQGIFGIIQLSRAWSRKHSCVRMMCESQVYRKQPMSVNTRATKLSFRFADAIQESSAHQSRVRQQETECVHQRAWYFSFCYSLYIVISAR